ncbi:hypothetical protein CHS0354_001213 [Potamilus streckersoni]|uniref:Uncharacterized protein n=1 Tax=Potamilus streckersoni TaxID=2493646 RepID=A0AAE0VKI5_9BIVA|nr:hypothetical protein CHS0354_001213 [Potamilus streckersoni]
MAMINCYIYWIFLSAGWYPTISKAQVAVCDKRTLDGCLQTIASLIEDNDNLIYRIKGMCSDNGVQATRCAIHGLVNCPDYLSKPTGHDMQLHFLEEITVQDQTDACFVWNGIPDDAKDKLNRAYTSKWTEVCVMMTSYKITKEPDGSRDVCGYMNLNDQCALKTIHEQYPQYEKSFNAIMNASLVFSSCVEHKHGHNESRGTALHISLYCLLIALLALFNV